MTNTSQSAGGCALLYPNPKGYSLRKFLFPVFLLLALLLSGRSFATSTRYYISAAATPTGSTSFCVGANTGGYSCVPTGSSCATTASANTCTVTWQWLLDGSPIGTSSTFVVSSEGSLTAVTLSAALANTITAGTHTLACRFTSSVTNCSATNPITSPVLNITVGAPPGAVTVSGGGTVCSSAALTASGGSGGTIYYQGTTSGGTSTTTASSSQTVSSNGTYYFRARSSIGCWGTQGSAAVTINPPPNVSSFNTTTSNICLGNANPVSIVSSSLGAGTFTVSYNLSGANSATGATASVTMSGGTGSFSIPASSLTNAGSTTITITNVRNSLLCNAAPAIGQSATFNVNALPAAVSVDGAGAFCEAALLSASGGSGGTIYYQGTTSNGTATGIASSMEVVMTSGTYYFRAQAPTGCWGPEGSAAITINPDPAPVTVTGGGTYCGSGTLTATGGSGGTIYYQGSTSGGTSIATPSSSQTISADGTYYFRARSSAGCWGTQGSASITINALPNITGLATTANNLCLGSGTTITINAPSLANGTYNVSYTLSGANTSGTTTTSVAISGGTGSVNIPTGMLTATGSTTATITQIENATGCIATPASGNAATFTVSNLPVVSGITSSTAQLCLGASVTFTAGTTSGPGAVTSFNWSGPASYAATTTSGTATLTPAATSASGLYSVTVTYAGVGCTSLPASLSAALTVNPLPSLAGVATSDNLLCEGNNFTLTSGTTSGPGTATWHWSGPAGYTNTTSTPTVVISSPATSASGLYSLSVSYPGDGCVSGTAAIASAVTVNALPTVAGVTASVGTICTGGNLTLTAGTVTGTGAAQYNWSGPDGFATATAADNHTLSVGSLAAAGQYTLNVSYPGTGCTSAYVTTAAIIVNDAPTISSISPSVTTLCTGATVTFTAGAVTGTGTPTYHWSGPAGYTTTTSTNTTLLTATNTTESGSYSVAVSYPGEACISAPVATTAITVNDLPTVGGITASSAEMCTGTTLTLTATAATGTGTPTYSWSGPDAYSDASLTSSVSFTPSTTNATGQYSLTVSYPGLGCTSATVATSTVTVNALPALAGVTATPTTLCEGSDVTLTAGTITGTGTATYNWWGPDSYSDVTATNTVTFTAATTNAGGTYSLTVTLPGDGCTSNMATASVTVNALPVTLTGTDVVCEQATTTLHTSETGTWSSADAGTASVDAMGVVTGHTAGTTHIIFTLPTGCSTQKQVTVNALPAEITGDVAICDQQTSQLHNTTLGGNWGASGAAATIDVSGLVTAASAGTATISYSLGTGCYKTTTMTVNPLPAALTGTMTVCQEYTTTLHAAETGTWTSANTSVATIDATGTIATGNAGTAQITFTLPTGCIATAVVTVHETPAAIAGDLKICEQSNTNLSSSPNTGTWALAGTIASITTAGMVTTTAPGTATISYTLASGCYRTAILTVDALPAAITGMVPVCEQATTTLSNATTGGSWTTDDATVATIGSTDGLLTGIAMGNANITYTTADGCITTAIATVNLLPQPITGSTQVCEGGITTLSCTTAGGTWAATPAGVATIHATSGEVTTLAHGTLTTTYSLANGCSQYHTITVNALPAAITGANNVCVGLATTIHNATTGGTWHGSNNTLAQVHTTDGTVTGLADGDLTITYSLPTGCMATHSFTVHPLPANLTGIFATCEGASSTIDDPGTGGSWTSGSTTIATISGSGTVSAIAAGNSTITYTLPTGCYATQVFTVHPLPVAFTGPDAFCESTWVTLSNTLTGGTWASSNPSVASITPATGIMTGMNAGTTQITYTLPTNCSRIQTVTVHPAVPAITGTATVCEQSAATWTNTATGGTWASATATVATVDASGAVTGVTAGNAAITYMLSTGCYTTKMVTVHPLPASIIGSTQVCEGAITTLSNTTAGGSWHSSLPAIGSVDASGHVHGMAHGTLPVTYQLTTTGCQRTATVTVVPLPDAQSVTGGGSYCAGGSGVAIGLAASATGNTYALYNGSTHIMSVAGTGAPLAYGLFTTAGSYSVQATNTATGCISNMTGSAVVNITPLVTPSVSMSSDRGDTICAGLLTTYTASPVNGGTVPVYEWTVNGTLMAGTSSYAYTPANGDVVAIKMTSTAACPDPTSVVASTIMTVIANQMPAVAITKTSGDITCQFDAASFAATSAWGGTTPLYTWLRNGSPAGTGATLSYTPAHGDVITCRLTSNYRCRLAETVLSTPITMNVDSVYVPVISIEATPGVVVPSGKKITLNASVTGAGPSPTYQWTKNGTNIPGANENSLAGIYNHLDEVRCYVKGSGACGLRSFNGVIIIIDESVSVEGPANAIKEVRLMPNPNKGQFVVSCTVGSNYNHAPVEVTNMLGQKVFSGIADVVNGTIYYPVSLQDGLANGMYLMTISSGTDRKTISFIITQ